MKPSDRILIAGARGMVGSAMVRALSAQGFDQLLTPTRLEVDFTRQAETEAYLTETKPDVVFVAAAKVGGILANDTYPADFARDNALIALNAIDGAYRAGVPRLLFLGSTCIYPRLAPQPIQHVGINREPVGLPPDGAVPR